MADLNMSLVNAKIAISNVLVAFFKIFATLISFDLLGKK
jgi:hypothetical protein